MRELTDSELEAVTGGKAALPSQFKPPPAARAPLFRTVAVAKSATGGATGSACSGGVCRPS